MAAEMMKRGRRSLFVAACCLLLLGGCEPKPKIVVLDLVTYSYLDRPIFDVFVDGRGAAHSGPYPETGGGSISGAALTLGPKKVTWRLDGPDEALRNGEVVTNKNSLDLANVVPGAQYLGIHIYPDDTVELIPSVHYPEPTEKGKRMAEELIRKKSRTKSEQ